MVQRSLSAASSDDVERRPSDCEKDDGVWDRDEESASRKGSGGDSDPEKHPHHHRHGHHHHHQQHPIEPPDANAVPVPGARPVEVDEDLEIGAVGRRDGGSSSGSEEDDGASTEGEGACEEQEQREGGLGAVLDRVLSRTTTKSSVHPGPPPDGGARAWLTVACAHLIILNTWGFIGSFGTFQTYYVDLLSRPPSDVAWIGSMQVFLLFFIGTFTGRATDAGYYRAIFLCGATLQVIGIFATAQCTTYWQFFLAQGVVMGLGNGCLFCPTVAVVSTYFHKKRALVLGCTASGTGTGGLIFPGIVRQLLPQVGFAWTIRTIGFIQIFGLVVAFFGVRPRVPGRKGGEIVDWAAFREPAYALYAIGAFLSFWGVYPAFFYIVSFSRDVIGLSYNEGLNLLLVINGVGIVGRIGPNFVADRFGAINMFTIFATLSGLTALCWAAVRDLAGLYAWTVCYGVSCAGIQSLFPAGLTSLTSDLRKTGVRLGMVFTIVSFASLTGPPIAGAIITRMGGSYVGAQVFSGAAILAGAAFMAASRTFRCQELGLGLRARV